MVSALVDLPKLNSWNLSMENGKQTDILVMDISKAFDKVSHSLHLHKLQYYGIQGELNSWIQTFLSNRK
jgi:hypothetical protein